MKFKCQRVALNHVNSNNTTYKITTRDVADGLGNSIQAHGVINPPILKAQGAQFIIVAGFKRIDACRQIGLQEMRCHVLPPEADPEHCARIAIIDNATQRDLNLIEQANAISLLSRLHSTEDQLVLAARACGLSVNERMVQKLRNVGRMPAELRLGLLQGFIAFPVALQLYQIGDQRLIQAITNLLKELKMGLNRQREMVDWIVAILRRDGIGIDELLHSGDMFNIRMNSDLDHRQKAQGMRSLIKKKRFPAITQYERQYNKMVRALKLSKGTRLLAPPHFEGQTYSFQFDFQSYEELLIKHREFTNLVKSDQIKGLWK